MWCLLFLFSIASAKELESTKLDKSGVILEKIPNVAFVKTHLKIATYVDLDKLREDISFTFNMTRMTKDACDKMLATNVSKSCEYEINSLVSTWDSVSHIINIFSNRNKRSTPWIGIVGKLAKTVIGTLDADDGIFFQEQFLKVKNNEDLLLKRINKQTMILDSLFDLLNKTNMPASFVFQNFNEKLNNFERSFSEFQANIRNDLKRIHAELLFRDCYSVTESVVLALKTKTDLLTTLLGGDKDHLNPFLFSPSVLYDKLSEANSFIPKNSKLPLPINWEYIFEYYRISTNSQRRFKSYLIFEANIPLVHSESFQVFKLTPVPVRIENNKYSIFKFENDILIADNDMKKFSMLDTTHFENCQHSSNLTLCPHLFIMKSSPSCETEILKFSNNIEKVCKRSIIQIENILFIKLFKPNSWVVINPISEVVHLNCLDSSRPIKLRDASIIEIKGNCKLISEHINLYPDQTVLTNITFFYNWNLNFSKINFNLTSDIDLTMSEVPKIQVPIISMKDAKQMASLGKEISELKKEKILLKKIETERIENLYFKTVSIVFIFVLFATITYKVHKKMSNDRKNIHRQCKDRKPEEILEMVPYNKAPIII